MGRKGDHLDDFSADGSIKNQFLNGLSNAGEVKKKRTSQHKINTGDFGGFINLFNSLHDGIIIQDGSGQILYVNKSTESITGISISALKKISLRENDTYIVDEQGKKINLSTLPLWLFSEKKPNERVMAFHPFNRKKYWVKVKTFPIYQKEKLQYVVNILDDITDLKEKEVKLLENEQRYKAFFENGLDGIFIVDKNSRIIAVNKKGEEILGIPKKKIIGMDSSKFIQAKISREEAEINKNEYARKGFWMGELEIICGDGKERIVEIWAKKDFNSGNTYVVLRDITEKEKTKNALIELNNKFENQAKTLETTLASATNHIYVVNKKGEYEYVNKAVCDAIGKKSSEIIGKTGKELGYPNEFILLMARLRDKVFENGACLKSETWFPTKSGKRYFEFTLNPVKNQKGKVLLVVKTATDITDRKNLEKKKDEFLGIASHELKTPLTSIKGYIQFLEKKFRETDDEETLHHILRVEFQLNRLTTLISDLLDVSKIGTGKMIFREEKFLLGELVHDVVQDFKYMYVTYEFIFKKSTDVYVHGDKYRVGQVLVNLISNALKYSPRNSKIIITMVKNKNEILVSVKDFGIGISPEAQDKIFERFYQLNLENGVKFSGLGLGLYISSEIVKRHGGKIWVESTPGEGSVFRFTLPIIPNMQI